MRALTLFAFYVSQTQLIFQASMTHCFFLLLTSFYLLWLCFCVIFKSLFPCSARMTSVSPHFYTYGKSLQLLWDTSTLNECWCYVCLPVSKNGHEAYFPVNTVPYSMILRLCCRYAVAVVITVGSLTLRLSQLLRSFYSRSNHLSSHKWTWSSFNAIRTTPITSPLIDLEANTQFNTIRKLDILFSFGRCLEVMGMVCLSVRS